MKKSLIDKKAVALTLGSLLAFEAFFLLICLIVSICYGESDIFPLAITTAITAAIGIYSISVTRKKRGESDVKLGRREGYLIVSLVWVVFSLFGALPYYIGGYTESFTDAYFETISGFSTTGATIFTNVEKLPHGIALWRSATQWVGGMGIIVLSLAILPFLGVGGMQLYIAEVTGPTKDKLTPRVMQTAQMLYGAYIAITVSEVILFCIGGMGFFDSVCHAMTTISTGGFSTKNDGILFWHSPLLEYFVCFYMVLAGVNFMVTFTLLKGDFSRARNSEEFNIYIILNIVMTLLVFGGLLYTNRNTMIDTEDTFRTALFESTALVSGTGFVYTDISQWHPFIWGILFICMIIGGSAGSASGGIKIMRVLLLVKNSYLEFKRLLHPQAIIPVKLNKRVVTEKIITNILAYVVIFAGICMISIIIFMLFGNEFTESAGMAISCLSNVGPGLASQTNGIFALQDDFIKWFMGLLMLIGRLEIFTVLFVLTPVFWKKS